MNAKPTQADLPALPTNLPPIHVVLHAFFFSNSERAIAFQGGGSDKTRMYHEAERTWDLQL